MSKILITGANGFIGSHLVEKFIAEGHEVFGLVRKTSDLSLIENMNIQLRYGCLLYTSPSPRDATLSRMPSSA